VQDLEFFFTLPIYNTWIVYIIYMEQYKCNVVLNRHQNNATSCFNTYQMQDLIYIESMLVICPFDIVTSHRIVLLLWQWVPLF
jgi:hypothetical protein